MDKIPSNPSLITPNNKTRYLIAGVAFVIISFAVYFLFIFEKGAQSPKASENEGEVRELAQLTLSQRPFVTLTPTSDGAEIIISIENMSAFDRMEYELTYLADNPQIVGDKITRGATGTDVNTKEAKYKKSILLGTASRGVRSPDIGITDGQLTLHMFKGDDEFLSETVWTFAQTGTSTQTVSHQSGNFEIETPSLGKSYWLILTETVGTPPNLAQFTAEDVVFPIWGAYSVAPQFTRAATLNIKLTENIASPQLWAYDHQEATIQKIKSTYSQATNTVSADITNFATFLITQSD